jgi:hypothetical protein
LTSPKLIAPVHIDLGIRLLQGLGYISSRTPSISIVGGRVLAACLRCRPPWRAFLIGASHVPRMDWKFRSGGITRTRAAAR